MNNQYLQYVREELMRATADLSGATKGQLQAWLEDAQFNTGRFKRKKQKVVDTETGKLITLNNPPIQGKQSRAKGSSIALIQHVEYATASWRRALFSLEEHHKSWLLWVYGENIKWEHQQDITCWVWEAFLPQLEGKRIAKKTIGRLRSLIWLAVQDAKAEISGRDTVEHNRLALLMGVSKSTWSETYLPYWQEIRGTCFKLDRESLIGVSRSRSQQKAATYQQDIAKPN
ncbi:antiterminator [Pectobacterium brasiliense]|uniref:bacteriophage antitermination protein Q n=1 Tax=Pectobacterium brasiliense TaxID=180957 RepID=UPI00202D36CB|nr:bacteriophage antitermination protein Q [Pectobacterium brasiliense]MCL6376760.1 antiterminator [Pectobacterium brasiliense]